MNDQPPRPGPPQRIDAASGDAGAGEETDALASALAIDLRDDDEGVPGSVRVPDLDQVTASLTAAHDQLQRRLDQSAR